MGVLRLAVLKPFVCAILLAIYLLNISALPGNRSRKVLTPLVVFDFECTKPSELPRSLLQRQIRVAMRKVRDTGVASWGNR